MHKKDFKYYMPTKVLVGEGKVSLVGDEAKGFGKRVFFVSYTKDGIAKDIVKSLENAGCEVEMFLQIESNPKKDTVDKAAQVCKEKECNVIVALGGGSVIDSAKGISVVAKYGGSIWDYLGDDKSPGPTIPIIAIPSTAGTGAEVTWFSVFSNPENDAKEAMAEPKTFPKVAIIDPTVTLTLPKKLTAYTGIDALSHAIEAYCAPASSNLSDALALEAIRLIGKYLRRAYQNGNDMEARLGMLTASMTAGIAIAQAIVGAAHGFGMTIGGIYDCHHGLAVGVLQPYVMEYNKEIIPEKIMNIGKALDGADSGVKAVKRLYKDIDVPLSLSEIGVKQEDIPKIVEISVPRYDTVVNPRKFTTESATKFLEELI